MYYRKKKEKKDLWMLYNWQLYCILVPEYFELKVLIFCVFNAVMEVVPTLSY